MLLCSGRSENYTHALLWPIYPCCCPISLHQHSRITHSLIHTHIHTHSLTHTPMHTYSNEHMTHTHTGPNLSRRRSRASNAGGAMSCSGSRRTTQAEGYHMPEHFREAASAATLAALAVAASGANMCMYVCWSVCMRVCSFVCMYEWDNARGG